MKACRLFTKITILFSLHYIFFSLVCMDNPMHIFQDKESYLSLLPSDLQKTIIKKVVHTELSPAIIAHASIAIPSRKEKVKYQKVRGNILQLEKKAYAHEQHGNTVTITYTDTGRKIAIRLPSEEQIISLTIEHDCALVSAVKYHLIHDVNTSKQIVSQGKLKVSPDRTKYIEAIMHKPIRVYDFETNMHLCDLTVDPEESVWRCLSFLDDTHVKALYHFKQRDPGFFGVFEAFESCQWDITPLRNFEKTMRSLPLTVLFQLHILLQLIKKNPEAICMQQISGITIPDISLSDRELIINALKAIHYQLLRA
jgi:hypothetical protein